MSHLQVRVETRRPDSAKPMPELDVFDHRTRKTRSSLLRQKPRCGTADYRMW